MSVAERVRRGMLMVRPAAPAQQGERIGVEIGSLDVELAGLRARRPAAALAALNGNGADQTSLNELDAAIETLSSRRDLLHAAREGAEAEAAIAQEQERIAERSKQVNATRRALERRDRHALDLAQAIKSAVACYASLLAASRSAQAALPDDARVEGGYLAADKLSALVEREIHRAVGGRQGPDAFPHGQVAYVNPATMVPLA